MALTQKKTKNTPTVFFLKYFFFFKYNNYVPNVETVVWLINSSFNSNSDLARRIYFKNEK